MPRLIPLLTALWMATPLAAQDGDVANGSQIGDWIVGCSAISVNQTSCRLRQTLTSTQTGQVIVNFIAAPNGTDNAVLVAQVPMGTFLPGGAVFRVASDLSAPQTSMIWQRCLDDLCEAAVELSADQLAQLAQDGIVLFGYRMARGSDPIIVEVNMGDLGRAINAIRG